MEMLSTPLCSVFARVTVEYSEVTLAPYAGEVNDEGVGIFHRPPLAFVVVDADLVCRVVAEMLVEGLETKNVLLAYRVKAAITIGLRCPLKQFKIVSLDTC